MIFLRYLMLLLLVSAFSVVAVAQQARVIHLGRRVGTLDQERRTLATKQTNLLSDISALSHPKRITEKIAELNIGLLNPVELSQATMNETTREQ